MPSVSKSTSIWPNWATTPARQIAQLEASEPYDKPVNTRRVAKKPNLRIERLDERRIMLLTSHIPAMPRPRPSLHEVIICRAGIFNCGIEGNVPYTFSLSTII